MADNAVSVDEDLYPEDYEEVKKDWTDYYWGTGVYDPQNLEEDDEETQPIHEAIKVGGFDDILNDVIRDVMLRRNRLIQAGVLKGKIIGLKSRDQYDDSQDKPRLKNGKLVTSAPKENGNASSARQKSAQTSSNGTVGAASEQTWSETQSTPSLTDLSALSVANTVKKLADAEINHRMVGNSPNGGPRSMVFIGNNKYSKSDIKGQHVTFYMGQKWQPSYLAGITGEIVDIGSSYFKLKVDKEPPAGTRLHRLWELQSTAQFNNDNLIPFLEN